ncbi:hypothetical protein [Tenacibaculum aiptasiae]|uniref:hypothetical protein n=1 Tax=Tenacibaculum aiptasiae TaxID=426481 RepID=UPI003B5A0097
MQECTSVISSKSTGNVTNLILPAASTTVCKDGAVTLNVAASGGVGNLTYQWQSATSLAGPYSDVATGTTASNFNRRNSTSVTSSKSTVTVND